MTYHSQSVEDFAAASFTSKPSEGCATYTTVDVFAADRVGAPEEGLVPAGPSSRLGFRVTLRDDCGEGDVIVDRFRFVGDLTASAFSVDARLGGATLRATVPTTQHSTGLTVPVSIDVTWEPNAVTHFHGQDREVWSEGGSTIMVARGTHAGARASGHVLLDGVDQVSAPTDVAELGSGTTVVINRFDAARP